MFRVREEFIISAKATINDVKVEGFSVSSVIHSRTHKASIRYCSFIKDYETRENYEKNFKILNDDFVAAIQKKLGISDEEVPTYEHRVQLYFLDNFKEPMTWKQWHENKSRHK